MKQIKKRKVHRPNAPPSPKQATKARSKTPEIWKHPVGEVNDEWSNLMKYLEGALPALSFPKEKLAPYAKPRSVIKRLVYSFVRKHLSNGNSDELSYFFQYMRRGEIRSHKNGFDDNPFHWALAAIPFMLSELKRHDIWKFGRQLLYAHRHDIDPDLLVGFIHQTGNPDEICKKSHLPDNREEWYLDRSTS